MKKDPTQFRERFKRWKEGELVYENGLALPAYEDGKDANDVPSYTPSIDDREQPGYRKYLWELSKARRNAFLKEYGDAAPIKNYYEDFLSNSGGVFNYRRWYNLASPAERKYGLKKGLAHWADADGKTSLHPSFSIESPYSGYKNPYNPKGIIGGKWIGDDHYEFSDSQINNDWPINKTLDEFDRSRKEEGSNTYAYYKGGIMLHEPTIIGKMPKYKDGLTPLKKSEVNTNLATYNPEEDLYKSRYTLPEVTITGTNKRPHTHAPIHYSKNAYKVLTGDLLGVMTTGVNVLSPSLWYGAVRDADGIQDGFNKLMRGNSGFVTEDYAKDHPYISTGVNLVGDAAVLGSSAITNKLRNLNFYKSYKISKAIDKGVILNPVISAYNRNPAVKDLGTLWDYQSYLNLVFPNSKIKDVQFHMGPKGIEQLKVSDGTVWNINPNAKGIYVSPDKSYPQAIRKHTTMRLENTPMSKNIIRNLHPKSWDKVNELYTEIYPTIIDTQNPLYTRGDWTWGMSKKKYDSVFKDYDAIVNFGPKWYQNVNSMPETILPSSNQTLILGSNKDLLGFKLYMNKPENLRVSSNIHNPNMTFYDSTTGDKSPLNFLFLSDIDRLRKSGIGGLTENAPSQESFKLFFGLYPAEYKAHWYSKLKDLPDSYKEKFVERQLNMDLDRAQEILLDVRRATNPTAYSWNNRVLQDGYDMLRNLYASKAYKSRWTPSDADAVSSELIQNMREVNPVLLKRVIVDNDGGIPMRVSASGVYSPNKKTIQVLDNGDQTINSTTHEFSHASDKGKTIDLTGYIKMKPKKSLTQEQFDYYNQDTEKRARIMSLLADMHKRGYNINSYNDIQDYLFFNKAFGNHNANSIFSNYDIKMTDLLDVMRNAKSIVAPTIGVGTVYGTSNK